MGSVPESIMGSGEGTNEAMMNWADMSTDGLGDYFSEEGTDIGSMFSQGVATGASSEATETLISTNNEMLAQASEEAYGHGQDFTQRYSDNQQGTSKVAGMTLKNAAVTGASGSYRPMYNAGSDGGEGFYDGISSWADAIANKAYSIVNNAVKSAKEAENSNSPSKETRKLGVYFDQGFILGLEDLAGKVHSTAGNVASTGLSAMREAVSKIHDILASDMDYEPTIRPVMDLSDVEAGARMINSTLSTSPTFTPAVSMADSARISAMMQNAQINADTARISNVQDIDTLITTTNNILSILKDPRAVTIDGNTVIGWVDRELGAFS